MVTMPGPNYPGIPRGKLPSVREIDATSGAPHTRPPAAPPPKTIRVPSPAPVTTEVVAIQGHGWTVSMVALAAILSTIGSIVGPRIAGPQSTPADIQMVQRIEEIDMRVRSIERKVTALGAGDSNQESQINDLVVEVARANRAIQKLKASEP
jgi:hypothetical protein